MTKHKGFKIGQQVATASGDLGVVVGMSPSTTITRTGEPVYVVEFPDGDEDYFSASELKPVVRKAAVR